MNAFVRPARKWSEDSKSLDSGGPIDEETHFLIMSLPCRPHCSAHLHVRSMSRRARARRSADTPDSPVSTYSKDTWGWEIVKVLRDAQRAGNSAGMTEADILLVIANTVTSRGNIKATKKKVPSYLNNLRSHLEMNKCGMFEEAECLYPDCKPKQQLWRLVPNAQTENIPDVLPNPFVSYAEIDLERYQLSEASANNIRESANVPVVPVAKTRGEKRARGGDDDAGDARNTARARLETPEGGAGDDAKEAAAQVVLVNKASEVFPTSLKISLVPLEKAVKERVEVMISVMMLPSI